MSVAPEHSAFVRVDAEPLHAMLVVSRRPHHEEGAWVVRHSWQSRVQRSMAVGRTLENPSDAIDSLIAMVDLLYGLQAAGAVASQALRARLGANVFIAKSFLCYLSAFPS